MSAGTAFLCSAGGLLVAMLIKLWDLRKNPRDPILRAVCGTLFLGALIFVTAAPPHLAKINEWFGTPNIAAPIVYCILTAFDGINIVLLIHWRGNEDEARTRRQTRLCLIAYLGVMAAIALLFALGDAPVERLRDLDTYYATTPFIREMIVLYLAAHSVAAVTMTVLCWRWSRQVPGSLRLGLLTIAAGSSFAFVFDLLKYTAVAARWTGGNLDWLSTHVAFSLAGVSALLVAAGFLIPPLGQGASSRWGMFQQFQQLKPLWLEIRPEIPRTCPKPMSWWRSMDLRLMQRERDIHDAVLRLGPYFDASTGKRVYAEALAEHAERRRARGEADASVIAGAVIAKAASRPAVNPEDRWMLTSTEDPEDLVRMSDALARSPRVQAIRRWAALAESRA
ncbi:MULTISPECIES: MAB_1171c family putative transporter [unclassified Streptomyces]|uniref:MAB_1171c family putative transporter n=1 Tax=unclassified Streptomyces TaxID=2593676 RepID=UPI001F0E18F0|nr:MAB_1171c family putative transporter [Streptomyces sp. A1136]